jgi:hypothetical protein
MPAKLSRKGALLKLQRNYVAMLPSKFGILSTLGRGSSLDAISSLVSEHEC